MYRYRRRRKLQRRRRATTLAVFAAVLAFAAGVPTLAAADPVNDVLNNLGLGSGSGDSAGGGTVSPQQTEPTYTPPLHGTNSHGQGTDAVVDIAPSADLPYAADPVTNGEELVVGSSRGEQNPSTGAYHGSVTLAYLFGNPIIQVETDPGETKDGPLEPLNQGLDDLCTQSGGQLCLQVLDMRSASTNDGSSNSFQGASVGLGGEQGLGASALSSQGNISDDDTCQTANGSSQVAGAGAGGELAIGLFDSSSQSQACNNGTSSVSQSSHAVLVNDQEVLPGCANGTPNTVLPFAPLLAVICNANDESGSQTSAPYGVREALTTLGLIVDLEEAPFISVVKATTAAAESHAVAPVANIRTPPTGSGGGGGDTQGAGGKGGGNDGGGAGGAGGAGGGGGGGAGAAAGAAAAGGGQLAFTGADLLALGMVGGALILGGLALTTTAGRRHRQTV